MSEKLPRFTYDVDFEVLLVVVGRVEAVPEVVLISRKNNKKWHFFIAKRMRKIVKNESTNKKKVMLNSRWRQNILSQFEESQTMDSKHYKTFGKIFLVIWKLTWNFIQKTKAPKFWKWPIMVWKSLLRRDDPSLAPWKEMASERRPPHNRFWPPPSRRLQEARGMEKSWPICQMNFRRGQIHEIHRYEGAVMDHSECKLLNRLNSRLWPKMWKTSTLARFWSWRSWPLSHWWPHVWDIYPYEVGIRALIIVSMTNSSNPFTSFKLFWILAMQLQVRKQDLMNVPFLKMVATAK